MSVRAAKWVFWLVLVCALPVPYFGPETGLVPVARLVFLGAVIGAVFMSDPDMVTRVLALLFLGQAAVWSILLLVVSHLAAGRATGGLSPRHRGLALSAAALVLLVVSLTDVYRTPFSSSGARTSLLEVFD